jgi:hypothetical protein
METIKEISIPNEININHLIENKFNSYHRNIDHDCVWNKFKIVTCVIIKKNPEYIKGPNNDDKLIQITDHIWNEGIKLMPQSYQIIINMDIRSHLIMWKDISDIIIELSKS